MDEKARDHVREVDLRSLGISDFGELQVARLWATDGRRPLRVVFPRSADDSLPAGRTRASGHRSPDFPDSTRKTMATAARSASSRTGFFYSGDRPRRWQDTSDLWVHGYWSWDWANSYERVAALDLDQRLIKTAPPYGQYGFRIGQRFYFLNVLEELDQPGEWFLDRQVGQALLLAAPGNAE